MHLCADLCFADTLLPFEKLLCRMRVLCDQRRLAPLSEGRIDADGTLMCSYHGEAVTH